MLSQEFRARAVGAALEEGSMLNQLATFGRLAALVSATTLAACSMQSSGAMDGAAQGNGVVRVRSAYTHDETIARVKQDIADKGIMFFDAYDQQDLAASAGMPLQRSTLLVFGNPALGSQLIASNPSAGLDWPVRLLITEDESGQVWAVYTDFHHIARRHGIADRQMAFDTASGVIASITASVASQ